MKNTFKKAISLMFCAVALLMINTISISAASLPASAQANGLCANHSAPRHRVFVLNHDTGMCEPCLPGDTDAASYCGCLAYEPVLGSPIMMAPNGDIITLETSGPAINGELQTEESFSAYIDRELPAATYAEKYQMVEDWSGGIFTYVPGPVLGPAIMMAPNGDYITADGTTIAINGVEQTPESFSRYVDENYPDATVGERAKMVEDWSGFPYVPAETRNPATPISDIGPAIWMGPDGTIYTADGSGVINVILP